MIISHETAKRIRIIVDHPAVRVRIIPNRTRELVDVLGVYVGRFSESGRIGVVSAPGNICLKDSFKYPPDTRTIRNDTARGYVGFAGGSSSSRAL